MDELPESVLLHILSRLEESSDIARCRVAWKTFNTIFPGVRSINLRCSLKWYNSRVSAFTKVFLDLISELEAVDSICIALEDPLMENLYANDNHDSYLLDLDFVNDWLPRVSGSLKSLSIADLFSDHHPSNLLPLISASCHNLINLKLEHVNLSVHDMKPMLMLTSLTLEATFLAEEQLNEWFPNLQVLHLVDVIGLKNPKIRLLKLKACLWDVHDNMESLTLITPNLISLKFVSFSRVSLHVEAPMLSQFYVVKHTCALTFKKFENLKTLWVDSMYIGDSIAKFPIIKTVETLTLESRSHASTDGIYLKLTLGKVFVVFPNVSSLCIKSGAWSELEACLNPQGWEILDGRTRLKTLSAYLTLGDPLLTFSSVAYVLDQCIGLQEVSLFIPDDVDIFDDTVSESFMSRCMGRWPGLRWKWETWNVFMDEQDEPLW